MRSTHQVINQAPPLFEYNALERDRVLNEALLSHGSAVTAQSLVALGAQVGDPESHRWAAEANSYSPVLRTHSRYGERIDEVDFHPSWHQLMGVAVSNGLHAAPWASADPNRHVRRAAGFYLWSQVEAGHGCPISMTYSILPALRHNDSLAAAYGPGLMTTDYDPGLRDPATKRGLLAGMGMTEKQGGSDVRANSTVAVPTGDGTYRITGHKWFCSAPMCDLFLVLAQVEGAGISCFCVPRVLPGGERNVFSLQRLKDKLGNRSNASSEVEFSDTVGWLVGEPGQGIRTILEMVTMTRLDCVIGSASGQRAALVQAIHHTRHRSAFGEKLINQPLMQAVLADLALEVEASTALMMRLAAAVDAEESALLRLALPSAKFWVCKRSPMVVGEALECLGGNGYVEESGLPRLYRDSPLNSIWEGSGNVISLDVLRAVGRDPGSVEALLAELDLALGADRRYDDAVGRLKADLGQALPAVARRLASTIALTLQASLLLRSAPAEVSDAFLATRLDQDWGFVFGALPAAQGSSLQALIERAF